MAPTHLTPNITPSESIRTGAEILAKAGKTAAEFKLYQHKRGHQPILIDPNQTVNLREPGVERFTTMPKDTTEGLEGPPLRRQFRLPQSDEDYLNGLALPWETIVDGGSRWLLVHNWKLPPGYNRKETRDRKSTRLNSS